MRRDGGPMARERLVVVGYPVDEEFAGINNGVLGDAASIAFLRRFPKGERMEVVRRAEALLSWNLRRDMPAGGVRPAGGLPVLHFAAPRAHPRRSCAASVRTRRHSHP